MSHNFRRHTLVRKFEEYDEDGTGYVTPDQALEILKKEFDGLPDSSVRAMIFRFDQDNNGMVDFEEFLDFYAFIKAK